MFADSGISCTSSFFNVIVGFFRRGCLMLQILRMNWQDTVLVHMIGDTFWKTGSLGNARGIEPFTEQFAPWKWRAPPFCARTLKLWPAMGCAWESCQIRSFPTFPPCLQLRSGIPQFLTPLECH